MDDLPEYPYIDSRYDDPREMDELRNFVGALKDWRLKYHVERVFYDTKSNVCDISIAPHVDERTADFIYALADDHIGQYVRNGFVYHGKPMADWHAAEWGMESDEATIDHAANLDEYLQPENGNEDADANEQATAPGFDMREAALRWDRQWRTTAEQRALAGLEGETALAEWFEREGLPYVAICQQPDTFASLFTGAVKRPDFLLLFDALGMIGVDAKNLSPKEWKGRLFYSLTLDDELKKAIAFERVFRMPVWYAIKGRDEWLWISALKAVEVGRTFQNSSTKANFVSIGKQHFVHVRTGNDLAGLYAQRMPTYQRVGALAG